MGYKTLVCKDGHDATMAYFLERDIEKLQLMLEQCKGRR
jgi:hypothetical protein